jgi:hypothetical protein
MRNDAHLDILAASFPDSDPRVVKGEAGTVGVVRECPGS